MIELRYSTLNHVCNDWLYITTNNHMLQQPNATLLDTALQTCYALHSCDQHTLFPQSSPQPHYNLNSLRLCIATAFGLCCLLWSTIFLNPRRISSNCFWLWGIVLKYKKKNRHQGYRLPNKHKTNRNQWTTTRQIFEVRGREVKITRSTKCDNIFEIGLEDAWSC